MLRTLVDARALIAMAMAAARRRCGACTRTRFDTTTCFSG